MVCMCVYGVYVCSIPVCVSVVCNSGFFCVTLWKCNIERTIIYVHLVALLDVNGELGTESCYVSQTDLEFKILLAQCSKCWNCKHMSPCRAPFQLPVCMFWKETKAKFRWTEIKGRNPHQCSRCEFKMAKGADRCFQAQASPEAVAHLRHFLFVNTCSVRRCWQNLEIGDE